MRLISDCEIQIDSEEMTCNKVLVFNLGFDRPGLDNKTHWTYIPMGDINFYRVGYYSNILDTDRVSMYVEIGFKEDEPIDVDNQLKLTLDNMKKLGIIDEHKLISYNSIIINPGYVHITEKSIYLVKKIVRRLRADNIFTIGRYGKWTYCSIEDCIIDARRLACEI